MDVIEMIIRRTGMTREDALYYEAMAEERIKAYLNDDDADMSKYPFQISDIAVLYYQRDTSNQNSAKTLGYSRETFREGAVSVEKAGMTGASVQYTYESAIDDVLLSLDGSAHVLRFL